MATVKFYLKKTSASGPTSIYMKFTVDRLHRFEVPTGERVPTKYWNAVTQSVKPGFRGSIELNLALDRIRTTVVQLWRDHKGAGFDSLKEMVRNQLKFGQTTAPVEKKTFHEAVDRFKDQYGQEMDKATASKYGYMFDKVLKFNPALDFADINFAFYDRFKSFLFAQPNPNYPRHHLKSFGDYYDIVEGRGVTPVGFFDDIVYKYISQFQTFLRWATKRGYQVDQTFEQWSIIERQHKPISLTMAELEKLEAAQLSNPSHRVALDYLLLECRTGQRISDLQRFDLKDFRECKWTFWRKKGNRISPKQVTVHFKGYCAPALEILARWNFRPPKISVQKLNKNIKEALREAGITTRVETFRFAGNKRIRIHGPKYEFISTHTGRKTFITIALQFMPPMLVKQLTGIESYKTLKHYEDDGDHSVIENYLNSITESKTIMRKAQ